MRPLVLIAWQEFAGGGGDAGFHQVQYFVFVPRSLKVAKQMVISVAELEGYRVQSIMSMDAMRRFALSRAQSDLDELADHQFRESHEPRTFYQPLALELADEHEAQALGLAEEYRDAWSFIRDHTLGQNLLSRLGMILRLREINCVFTDAPTVPGRMR